MSDKLEKAVEKEAMFGVIPVMPKERIYGFMDAFLVLSGYVIATWSYTQGSYLSTLVGFKQLLISGFLGAILMLAIYQLPVILSTRYGIDIWIWLKAVFGRKGVWIMTILIIIVNWPWYAVCAEMFASSMKNMLGLLGIAEIGRFAHVALAILCVALGTFIAYKGLEAITWVTRLLVPLLLLVGVVVVVVGFVTVPVDVIWNYVPKDTGYSESLTPYILSVEANVAYVITLIGGMAGIPRLTKKENSAYWAGVFSQGVSGSFFVVIGAIMAIATEYVTGSMIDDPTKMLTILTGIPALALCSLMLVAFANIGTQAVGCYIYGIMLKSAFPKGSYRKYIIYISLYVAVLCVWGKIIEYFGSFLTVSACIYAPLAALLFVDFFFVRKQRLSMRAAFNFKGHNAYEYNKGINWVGLACVVVGIFLSLMVYNPLTGVVNIPFLFKLTPTGFAFIGTGIVYFLLTRIPAIKKYMLQDRDDLTV